MRECARVDEILAKCWRSVLTGRSYNLKYVANWGKSETKFLPILRKPRSAIDPGRSIWLPGRDVSG
jgi:hypothetical protein